MLFPENELVEVFYWKLKNMWVLSRKDENPHTKGMRLKELKKCLSFV